MEDLPLKYSFSTIVGPSRWNASEELEIPLVGGAAAPDLGTTLPLGDTSHGGALVVVGYVEDSHGASTRVVDTGVVVTAEVILGADGLKATSGDFMAILLAGEKGKVEQAKESLDPAGVFETVSATASMMNTEIDAIESTDSHAVEQATALIEALIESVSDAATTVEVTTATLGQVASAFSSIVSEGTGMLEAESAESMVTVMSDMMSELGESGGTVNTAISTSILGALGATLESKVFDSAPAGDGDDGERRRLEAQGKAKVADQLTSTLANLAEAQMRDRYAGMGPLVTTTASIAMTAEVMGASDFGGSRVGGFALGSDFAAKLLTTTPTNSSGGSLFGAITTTLASDPYR